MSGRSILTMLVSLCLLLGLNLAMTSASASAREGYIPHGTFGEPCQDEPCGKGQFKEPAGVAVDSSGEPLVQSAAGDVYVIDVGDERVERFSGSGAYIGQFTGDGSYEAEGNQHTGTPTPAGSFAFNGEAEGQGIAVDGSADPLDPAAGDVYVMDAGHGVVDQFDSNGAYVAQMAGTCSMVGVCPGKVVPFPGGLQGVAVDGHGNLWVYEDAGNVDEFSDTGAFVQSFNTGRGTAPALAVDAEDNIYVGLGSSSVGKFEGGKEIAEFDEGVTALAVDSKTGSVLVDKRSAIDEYPSVGASKIELQEVYNEVSESHGMAVNTATNAIYASLREADQVKIFDYAQLFPTPVSESTTDVNSTEATLSAQINAYGYSTTYLVEYGTSEAFGSSTTEEGLGAPKGTTQIEVRLSGLQPKTEYHARFVVRSEQGVSRGEDLTFMTAASLGGSTSVLPDKRAYELVSPVGKLDVYEPILLTGSEAGRTERPFRASEDGNAVAYVGEPPSVGGSGSQGNGEGDEFVAKRTSHGWSSSDIVPPRAYVYTQYVGLSSDLSVGILNQLEAPASAPCDSLFSRTTDGVIHPFFTEQPAVSCGSKANKTETSFDGASADESHLLFESQAALTPGATESDIEGEYNLYDSVEGRLQLVNVLPGGQSASNSTFGGPHGSVGEENNAASFTNDISANGSDIFWTDLETNRIYLRENGTATVPVSEGAAEFWLATPDGRYVFYTEGEGSASRLWRFSVDKFEQSKEPEAQALAEAREALTGEEAGVQGVIGINETGEDGAYVYFVADGVLASNENSYGEKALAGAPNLYLLNEGKTQFVATLSAKDNDVGGPAENNEVAYGDWQHNLGTRVSEVTPDGHAIGFMSSRSLTGYDNRGQTEIYVFDLNDDRISCASCDPNGAAPTGGARVPTSENTISGGSTYMIRWLSDDGSRVFFDTREPLLPQVTDGLWNVYEWERDGAGSCGQSSGCTYLLSGGGSPEDSYLVDASASGDDVFFTSREGLTPPAGNETVKLYDARVDGGFPETSIACTGTGCQGVPPAPPIFATPSSVTFNGVGNFESPATTLKPKTKQSSGHQKAEKLAKALKRCAKKPKRRRVICQRQAKQKYASAKKRGKR